MSDTQTTAEMYALWQEIIAGVPDDASRKHFGTFSHKERMQFIQLYLDIRAGNLMRHTFQDGSAVLVDSINLTKQ